jgi:hypothetical protein
LLEVYSSTKETIELVVVERENNLLREKATEPENTKGCGRRSRRVKFDASYDE